MDFRLLEPPVPPVPLRSMGLPKLSEEAAFGRKNCANCSKPHSALWCGKCAENDVGQLRVFYCTEVCQEQHAAAHGEVCKARRRLSRAVSIFTELWTTFEEVTYSTQTVFVREKNGKVFVRLRDRGFDGGGWTGESILTLFPRDVLPGNTSDAIKKAVLFDQTCAEIASVGLPLVNVLLKGITSDIHDGFVEPKDPALVVSLLGYPALPSTEHCVLRVSLHTRETFVVDFTSAQFGWSEQLYTWDTYVQHRVKRVLSVEPLGTVRQNQEAFLSFVPRTSIGAASDAIRSSVMEKLTRSLAAHLVLHKTTAREFLSLPETAFIHERACLVNDLKDSMRDRAQKLQDLGIGRHFLDDEFRSHIARTAEEALKYKNVWLSKEDYDANKDDLNALKHIWTQRMERNW